MEKKTVSLLGFEPHKRFCTSFEQSERLVKLGLDTLIADCIYIDNDPGCLFLNDGSSGTPAWSVQVLADLCNSSIMFRGQLYNLSIDRVCGRYNFRYQYFGLGDLLTPRVIFEVESWYLIDCACETVCWLLENHIGLNRKGSVCCDHSCRLCKSEKCSRRKHKYDPKRKAK